MNYVFVHLREFSAQARKWRLTLEDLQEIENQIAASPARWPVIQGSGGLRKIRFSPESSAGGKSGGLRVCYFLVDAAARIYLVTAFAKNEKANLGRAEIRGIAAEIAKIKARHR